MNKVNLQIRKVAIIRTVKWVKLSVKFSEIFGDHIKMTVVCWL